MFFPAMHRAALLALPLFLSYINAGPLPPPSSPNLFTGAGLLVALQNGEEVGCLWNVNHFQNLTVDFKLCSTYYARTEEEFNNTTPIIVSLAPLDAGWNPDNNCAWEWVGQDGKYPKYIFGCGWIPGHQLDNYMTTVTGIDAAADYAIMLVAELQGSFSTFTTRPFGGNDDRLPQRWESKEIYTDELRYSENNFQIAWKAI